jgi:catechol 2,3-dioxygenase-like lactoylglutathione lyase family enzyme
MTVVTLAMQAPAAARDFYLDKLGFKSNAKDVMVLDLPGTSGEQLDIVPVDLLGAKSSITLTTASLSKAEARLKAQGVAVKKTKASLTVTDPDGNLIEIVAGH